MHSKFIYHVTYPYIHIYIYTYGSILYIYNIKKKNILLHIFQLLSLVMNYSNTITFTFLPLTNCGSSSYASPRSVNLTNG